ncbi:MAG: RimK family alpha-L-glutamate ligase [Synergistetes bacterium]|nr:RimK family alpha-L-glutamate ligase [Synergistota bacterium]
MKLGIVSSGVGWQVEELRRVAEGKGWSVVFLHPASFSIGLPCFDVKNVEQVASNCGAILVRSVPLGSLEQVIFRLDALYALESMGIPVVNSPFTIERTVDKLYSSIALSKMGIPTPKTVVVEKVSDAMNYFEQLGSDVIVKPIFGSNGVGVIRVRNKDEAYRIFKGFQLLRYVFYMQEFIPHGNYDIRVFWACGKVVSAMRRVSDGWKNNISQGSSPERYKVNNEMAEVCERVAETFKADYVGIDFLISESNRIYVLEVNGIPGWKGLQSITDVNIASEILRCVEKRKAL